MDSRDIYMYRCIRDARIEGSVVIVIVLQHIRFRLYTHPPMILLLALL